MNTLREVVCHGQSVRHYEVGRRGSVREDSCVPRLPCLPTTLQYVPYVATSVTSQPLRCTFININTVTYSVGTYHSTVYG